MLKNLLMVILCGCHISGNNIKEINKYNEMYNPFNKSYNKNLECSCANNKAKIDFTNDNISKFDINYNTSGITDGVIGLIIKIILLLIIKELYYILKSKRTLINRYIYVKLKEKIGDE